MLNADEQVFHFTDADQFVELYLYRGTVTVLRILNKKHHQERDNRRSSVDDELPRIRIFENRSGNAPQQDDRNCDDEGGWAPCRSSDYIGQIAKQLRHAFFLRRHGGTSPVIATCWWD